uniref:Uncharacterized protein n=1 Tax=Lepeophtheirus salmonis TaxID=72036 RepID=A0A0K2TPL4_LEPSM
MLNKLFNFIRHLSPIISIF